MIPFAAAFLAFMLSAAEASSTEVPEEAAPALMLSPPVCAPSEASFGYRVDPITKRVAYHSGLDFDAPLGTPVHAAAAGRVLAAEKRGPYGLMVEIDHGSAYRTRYGYLSEISVAPGQIVQRGETIAKSGATGRANGPQLHFEVWLRDLIRDPRKHLIADPACDPN